MAIGQVTQLNVEAVNYGNIKFGLIWGTKQYDYGYGLRDENTFIVYDEYSPDNFVETDRKNFIPGIITTLCFIGIATIFTALSVIFSLLNTMTVPIQTIHGPHGLYIWNGIAAGCGLVALIVYTAIFKTSIDDNIQSPDERNFQFQDGETAKVGYSFWVLLGAVILVLANIGIIFLAQRASDPDYFKRKPKTETNLKEDSKNVADGIIY